MDNSYFLEINDLNSCDLDSVAIALEQGKIVFLPSDGFMLDDEEHRLLNENRLAPKQKNISYHHLNKSLEHLNLAHEEDRPITLAMMSRFSNYAYLLIKQLFPNYSENLEWGRTSFRPAKVEGRQTSVLKDDTRLHVDAFKSSPVHGKRILRVFSNINPDNLPRVWHIGELFTEVVARFKPLIPKYSSMLANIQVKLKLTKTKRSLYDHMMLSLHDQMKKDEQYQAQVKKIEFHFPANSTWVVFTDQVSHAALAGQFLLEQSFYLPVEAQVYPKYSPLAQLMA